MPQKNGNKAFLQRKGKEVNLFWVCTIMNNIVDPISEESQYVFKQGKNEKTYFNLKAKNHQVILNSQGYFSGSDAKSWLGDGDNKAISLEQITTALGPGKIT